MAVMNSVQRTNKAVTAANKRELTRQKAKKAYQLRQAGASWWDIAEELKVSEPQVRKSVAELINDAADTVDYYERRQVLSLELNRLDALQQAVWADAMDGKVTAVQAALSIMDRRAKWLGFAEPPEQQSATATTIVVPNDSKSYLAALEQVRSEIEGG